MSILAIFTYPLYLASKVPGVEYLYDVLQSTVLEVNKMKMEAKQSFVNLTQVDELIEVVTQNTQLGQAQAKQLGDIQNFTQQVKQDLVALENTYKTKIAHLETEITKLKEQEPVEEVVEETSE